MALTASDARVSDTQSLAPGSLGLKRKGGKSPLYIGEEEWRLVTSRFLLFPVAPGKMTFDLVVMLAVVYSCVVVPYRTVFEDGAYRRSNPGPHHLQAGT